MAVDQKLVQQLATMDEEEYFELYHRANAERRTMYRKATGLPQNPTRDQLAEWLARQDLHDDPEVLAVYQLTDAPAHEIRLLTVYGCIVRSEPGEPIRLSHSAGVEDFPQFAMWSALIAPDEVEPLTQGKLLPPGWKFAPYRKFERS